MKRIVLASVIAAAFAAGPLHSETCLSPYIKGLKAPEKVMYLWTLPSGEGADYLSVIDVNIASPTYGKILKRVEVGLEGQRGPSHGLQRRPHPDLGRPRSTATASSSSTSAPIR
jgi:hypothetical protein